MLFVVFAGLKCLEAFLQTPFRQIDWGDAGGGGAMAGRPGGPLGRRSRWRSFCGLTQTRIDHMLTKSCSQARRTNSTIRSDLAKTGHPLEM